MNMKMLNGSELVRTVRRIARENPKATAGCTYVHRATPNCIVGVALHECGVPIDSLKHFPLPNWHYFPLRSERYKRWLHEVQWMQDAGSTWSEAVEYADRKNGKVW